jgi:plastocyanin
MRGLPYFLISIAALAIACGGDDDSDAVDAATSADAPAIDGSIVPDAVVPDADPAAPDAEPGAPDARPADANVDAKVSPVEVIDCLGANVDVTVTVARGAYVLDPDATIPVDGVARFQMTPSHDAASGAPNQPDGVFLAPAGATTCIKFLEPGSFRFHCQPHDFEATLTVAAP